MVADFAVMAQLPSGGNIFLSLVEIRRSVSGIRIEDVGYDPADDGENDLRLDDGRLPRRDVGVTSPADQHHQASAPAPS